MIRAEANTDQFQRNLEALGKGLPGVMAKALNDTTRDAKVELERAILTVFDRPTPLTQRSVFARFANAQRLVAEVWLRDEASKGTPPVKYLGPEVRGGSRREKSLEVRLRRVGLLGSDEWLVPSRTLGKDAFGNVPAGISKKILSQLQAQFDVSSNESARAKRSRNRQKTKRGGRYFAGRPGGKRYGIWERIETGFGSSVRPVFIAVRKPSYQKRFQVYDIVRKTWDARLRVNLERRMAEIASQQAFATEVTQALGRIS
jgi:hypothetical protein